MTCTASIILDPRIIVTAAHCIASRDEKIGPSKLIFQPAYQSGSGKDIDQFEATVWALGSRQRSTGQSARDAANDWAILVLDRAPVGVRPLRLRTLSGGAPTRLERQVLMPSYAIDAAGGLSLRVDPACSVLGLMWNVLLHDCGASPGASGAPLLIRDRQWYVVVGVHTASLWGADEEGHIAKFIGNSASGAWSFADALTALSRRLKGEAAHDVAYHGH
jgi:V8-like Glu-specific endopeptidase